MARSKNPWLGQEATQADLNAGATGIPPDPYEAQQRLAMQQLQKSYGRYQGLIDQQNALPQGDEYQAYLKDALAKKQAQEGQMDLTPLLALADQWAGGGNLAQTYQAMDPLTKRKKEGQVAMLQQALAKRAGELSQSQRESLASQLKGEAFHQQVLGSQVKPPKPLTTSEKTSVSREKRYLRDSIFKKFTDELGTDASIRAAEKAMRFADYVEKNGIPVYGDELAEFKRLNRDLLLEGKEAAKLGALAGPDVDIMEAVIGGGSMTSNLLAKIQGQSKEGLADRIRKNIATNKSIIGRDYDLVRGLYKGDDTAQDLIQTHYDTRYKPVLEYSRRSNTGGKRKGPTPEQARAELERRKKAANVGNAE